MTYRHSFVALRKHMYIQLCSVLCHISVYSSIFCETEKKCEKERERYKYETYALIK